MPTSIRLPHEAEQRLAALAERTGRTKAFYIREAILQHLEELEDAYLAQDVRERVAAGQEATHSLDDIEREIGMER